MAGTYAITENKSDAIKFRGMVSFNGKDAEYYEVDYTYDEEGAVINSAINAELQACADMAVVEAEKKDETPVLEIAEDGKLVE